MFIALRPLHIAGKDYRIDDEIPDELVTHRLEVTGLVKHIAKNSIAKNSIEAPVLSSDGSISAVELTPQEVRMALLFFQQTPANAAKAVAKITSNSLLEYLKQADTRKAVQVVLDEKMNGGEMNAGGTDSTAEQSADTGNSAAAAEQ